MTELILGRGEVFFEVFEKGTTNGLGERYIGNTPSFRIQRDVSQYDRKTSYRGKQVNLLPETISESHKVQFVTDHISMENIGLWYGVDGGELDRLNQGGAQERFTVKRGRFFQLGMSVQAPGIRNVRFPHVSKVNGGDVSASGNWRLDGPMGRIEIFADAANLQDGDEVDISFEWADQNVRNVGSEPELINGALRFIARNPVGPQHHYYAPFVQLAANGQVDLKGDEFQRIGFEAQALNRDPNTRQIFVDAATLIN